MLAVLLVMKIQLINVARQLSLGLWMILLVMTDADMNAVGPSVRLSPNDLAWTTRLVPCIVPLFADLPTLVGAFGIVEYFTINTYICLILR